MIFYLFYFIFPLQIPHQYKNLRQNQAKDEYEKHHAKLIHELIECDEFDDIATLKVRDVLHKFAIQFKAFISIKFLSIFFFLPRILVSCSVKIHRIWRTNSARLETPSYTSWWNG